MATPALNDTTSDNVLAALRRGARERGLLRPATSLYALRLAALLPLLLVLQLVAWSGASGPLWWLSALAAGIVAVQIGFVAHDAGHRAVGRSGWVNQAAGQLAFSVVNGLGFQSWIARHDAHHAHCQDESQDPDMWVGTVMSLTPDSAARKTGVGRLLLPLQAYYLWPVSLLFAHSLRIESLFQSYSRPRAYLFDVLLLPLHYGLWWVAPLWLVDASPGRVFAVYAISSCVVGLYLAVLFWLNHIGMPILEPQHDLSEFEQQVTGSRNVRTPRSLDFVFGGLNHQIEHHLLPGCPSWRLRRLAPHVRRVCEVHSLPYREEGIAEAIGSVTRHVARIAAGSRHAEQ